MPTKIVMHQQPKRRLISVGGQLSLRKSLGRLSSGNRINSPSDDAGGMAVAYKMESTLKRTEAAIQNSQNGLSYLQVQDGALKTVGNILTRMSELRTVRHGYNQETMEWENYSKEFIESQSQMNQIADSSLTESVCSQIMQQLLSLKILTGSAFQAYEARRSYSLGTLPYFSIRTN